MPRYATGAISSPRISSALSVKAPCTDGQEIRLCRAASAGVMPRSATSAPAWASSRRVIWHRGGSCGTHSVNVPVQQLETGHSIRRLTRNKSASSPQIRTSCGAVTTYWCTFSETVPHSGHDAGAVIFAQTDSRPPGSLSASVTITPSIPSITDAVSWAGADPGTLIVTNRDHRVRAPAAPAATRTAAQHYGYDPPATTPPSHAAGTPASITHSKRGVYRPRPSSKSR